MPEQPYEETDDPNFVIIRGRRIQTYIGLGQRRFKCDQKWESGAPCEFDYYSIKDLLNHIDECPTREGKKKQKQLRVVQTPLLDASGNSLVREVNDDNLPAEYRAVHFKK